MSELYAEDLDTLKCVMGALNAFTTINGISEVEVWVRVDEVDNWAVIGYGENGGPALLRFEPVKN